MAQSKPISSKWESKIKESISGHTFSRMEKYLRRNAPLLMGSRQPKTYLRDMFIFTLAHDVLGKSFNQLMAKIKLIYKIGNTTLQINVHRIRGVLCEWADEQIFLGDRDSWDTAVLDIPFPSHLQSVRFWIDSSDVPIERKKGRGPTSPHWSGKLGRPARRYMFLLNGDQLISKMWGGYSPKLYDGHFVESHKQWFDKKLANVALIGDTHFHSVRDQLRKCQMIAPRPTPASSNSERGQDEERLTADQQKKNAEIRRIRARCEQPFGMIKSQMQILKRPWAEELHALDSVVTIGTAIYNVQKRARAE
jgi:hypothetical protein